MKLIVNADDFGYSRAVNYGIADACRFGIVRSTTAMVNMPAFDHALDLAASLPQLGVGIHLVLTSGPSLSRGKTISDEKGFFFSQSEFDRRLENDEIDFDEVEREFEAQIQYALQAGLHPSHLDSHHHKHLLPEILPVFLGKMKQYRLPGRGLHGVQEAENLSVSGVQMTEDFSDEFYGEAVSVKHLIDIIERRGKMGSLEIMCHPAYVDDALLEGSSYNVARIKEYKVLTSPEIFAYLEDKEIELANYISL